MRNVIFIVFCIICIVGTTSAFSVPSFSVDPSGSITSGNPVTVAFTVFGAGKGPGSPDLRFYTDLDNPTWTYTVLANGIENPRPVQGGKTLEILGFELSYNITQNVSLKMILKGTTPSVTDTMTKTIARITELDTQGRPVDSSKVEHTVTVIKNTPIPTTPSTTQKSQEVVHTGVQQASSSLQVVGNVYGSATANGANVDYINFTIALAPGGTPIDVEKMVITYSTSGALETLALHNPSTIGADAAAGEWNVVEVRNSVGGTENWLLERGEQFDIKANPTTGISPDTSFNLEVKPVTGAALGIKRITPVAIKNMNILYESNSALTTVITTSFTTVPTMSQTTIKTPTATPTPDYDAKIAALEKQVAEQNKKIEQQGTILDQISYFLRNVFGWR